jgi:alanine or glycine:cation symporter, AGCS family
MSTFLSSLESAASKVSCFIWGPPLLIALFGAHLFLTFRLGFIQRRLGSMIRLSVARDYKGAGDVSHWGALTTAMAATVGTGNIVGVATALALGGPGALLWMWLTGVFGIATKYAEALIAVKHRVRNPDGTHAGGAMYVLRDVLKMPRLGAAFAVLVAVAAFGIGNMVQAHSIADFTTERFGLPGWATGLGLAALAALVIFGGIRSIARVCAFLIPLMIVGYLGGCLILLVKYSDRLPDAIRLVFESAFAGHAAAGGFLGAGVAQAVRYGIARGLFSNESGMGSGPIVAAAARTADPVRQALVSASATFWDTVVVCACTGLALLVTGEWQGAERGAAITTAAFGHLGAWGPWFLYLALFTFCFSTILGWAYYGERGMEFLFGQRSLRPYRIAWVLAVFLGSSLSLQLVWDFADIANGLMVIPNLIALLLLHNSIARDTRAYFAKNRSS